MKRNSVLLSIGAALVLSLLVFDASHAVQIDRTKQFPPTRMAEAMNEVANAPATQVASTPIPCRGDGMRRTGAPCTKQSLPGSPPTAGTLYIIIAGTASVIFMLGFLLLLVSLSRHTPQPPFIKSTH